MEDDPLAQARNCTKEARKQNFLAFIRTLENSKDTQKEPTAWHEVSDPPTPEQYNEIPPGRPGVDSHSKTIWIKYRHDQRRHVVVARGYFDHEDGRWRAQYHATENGDLVCVVEAIAWAYITPGLQPWDGPII